MEIKQINDLISLMAAVCCSEIDGTMCQDYTHQINETLDNYPEDIKHHFIECWIIVSRCVQVNIRKDCPEQPQFEPSYCDKIWKDVEENNLESNLQQLAEDSDTEDWLTHIGENYVEFVEPGQGILKLCP